MSKVSALCALLTAAGIVLAQAPYQLSFLAFVALVPFVALTLRAPDESPLRAAYLAGLSCFGVGCFWLRHTHPLNLVLMTAIEALTFPLALVVLRRLRALRVPLAAALPIAWVAVEWVRSYWPFNGFPYLVLGNALAHPLEWAQNSDLLGPFGLSAFAALVNGCLATALLPRDGAQDAAGDRGVRSGVARVVGFGGALLVPLLLWRRGANELELHPRAESTAGGPILALIQANIPQELKQETKKSGNGKSGAGDSPALQEARDIVGKHVRLTEQAVAAGPVDLVVWPETMISGWFRHSAADPVERKYLESWLFGPTLRRARTQILLGVLTTDAEHLFAADTFNTAVLYDCQGIRRGRYSKTILVPGGEFIPFRSWLGFIIDPIVLSIAPVVPSLTPGVGPQAMHLTAAASGALDTTFGVTICYENVYAEYVREVARLGVDFVINTSNEGWFKRSAEFDQMNAASVLRAIETRRPLVRATNTGISAAYDWAGRRTDVLLGPASDSASEPRDREVEGILRVQVPRQKGDSVFLRIGELPIALLSGLTFGLLAIHEIVRRYRLAKGA